MKFFSTHISFVVLLCLAFFLAPNTSSACVKKSSTVEQSSCSKKQTPSSKEKDCCKTNSCKNSKEDKKHCNGGCKDNSCQNNASYSSMRLPSLIEIKKTYFAELKKQNFGFKESHYFTCYLSIWQPPKIG